MSAYDLPSGGLLTDTDTRFPYQVGYDAAGVVTDIGEEVKGLKVGDEVYTRLPEVSRGNNVCHYQQDDKLGLNYAGRSME